MSVDPYAWTLSPATIWPTAGLPGYFIDDDAHGDPWVWRENGDWPMPALAGYKIRRDDPELWAAIVRAVDGGAA